MKGITKLEFACIILFIFSGFFCFAGCFFNAYLIVPSIKLKGQKEITIDVGSDYKDSGVIAMINDEDVTNRVVRNGDVNTSKIGEYEIVYSITNSRGYQKRKVKRMIKVVDMEKPVIKLKGKTTVVVSYGDSYQESGYTAKDDYDGDLTDKVVIRKIDTSKLGKYTLTYSVVDSSGNKIDVNRKVNVVDNKAPTIDLDGKSLMVVKLNAEFKDPGYTAVDNYDGDVTDKVTVSGKINTAKMSTYKLTYKVKDSFGNIATKVRKVQVGSQKDRDKLTYILMVLFI